MLYEYIQSFSVAIFSSDPQRSHPMNVSGSYFGSVSKQQHQNSWTPDLVQQIGAKGIKKGGRKVGRRAFPSLDWLLSFDALTLQSVRMLCCLPLQLHGWPSIF